MRLLPIHETQARRILSPVSGFLADAGFTHSLTPARNCTYGCTYCYVPTMRVQGGLRPEDWRHWGEYTVYKRNASQLLRRELRPGMVIYCSPLTDPYQPAESSQQLMPDLLESLYFHPPKVFVLQTRGAMILRDARLLLTLAERTTVRISFSITTNDDRIRKIFEPRCEPIPDRLAALRALREMGLDAHATIAPILPCEPPDLARLIVDATGAATVIGDPLHVRQTKPRGATTRDAALKILDHYEQPHWADAAFQVDLVRALEEEFRQLGAPFLSGPEGFRCLTQT
jgi:DNA repair photolyase